MPGALENGDLQVDYQPVVALEGGGLVGIEAVLRWQHPQLGALSHERCAQLAEQTGVLHAVGLWWLRTAADQARAWRQRPADVVPPVAVDLTSSQAQDPDLVATVGTGLARNDLRPTDLEFRDPGAGAAPWCPWCAAQGSVSSPARWTPRSRPTGGAG